MVRVEDNTALGYVELHSDAKEALWEINNSDGIS